MKVSPRVALALLAAVPACFSNVPHPHQPLSAPAPGANDAERTAAYERLFARADAETVLVARGTVVAKSTDYIVLGDGTRVYHAEDLAAVVEPESPTARHGRRSGELTRRVEKRRDLMQWIFIAGLVGTVTGLGLSAIGMRSDDGDGSVLDPVGGVLAGVSVVGTAGAVLWLSSETGPMAAEANDERVSAFTTYNQDLRKRLSLCTDGTRTTACPVAAPTAAATPAAATLAAPGPATSAPAAPAAP